MGAIFTQKCGTIHEGGEELLKGMNLNTMVQWGATVIDSIVTAVTAGQNFGQFFSVFDR